MSAGRDVSNGTYRIDSVRQSFYRAARQLEALARGRSINDASINYLSVSLRRGRRGSAVARAYHPPPHGGYLHLGLLAAELPSLLHDQALFDVQRVLKRTYVDEDPYFKVRRRQDRDDSPAMVYHTSRLAVSYLYCMYCPHRSSEATRGSP